MASQLDGECEWLLTNGVLPADLVTRNRRVAEAALRPWTPVFTHGDLQIAHVFVDGDEITGVIDWTEAAPGRCPVRPRHPDARTPGAPRRRHRRLRHRRRPRRDPRVVVVAKPAGDPLAGRARLRPVLARLRGRRAEIPAVRLHEPDGYECRFAALMAVPSARRDRRRVRGVRGPDCTSQEADRRDRGSHLGPFGLCDATRAGLKAGHIRPASILGADGPKGMQRLPSTGPLPACVRRSQHAAGGRLRSPTPGGARGRAFSQPQRPQGVAATGA